MPERAWTLRSISCCQISSVNIVPGVKIQSLFQQLYIKSYPCAGHRVRGQVQRDDSVKPMNMTATLRWLKVCWGDRSSTDQFSQRWSLLHSFLELPSEGSDTQGPDSFKPQTSQRLAGTNPTLGTSGFLQSILNTQGSLGVCIS